jgi:hypothetical protein
LLLFSLDDEPLVPLAALSDEPPPQPLATNRLTADRKTP